jgi:agmatine/peptidylarginine deiminase
LDFCFNGWGEKFESQLDNAINRRIYDEGKVTGEYVDRLDFVLEGGSIESDGRGTVFTTSCCLLAPHRNQPMTKAEIEARLKRDLCAERVLWIDYGHLTGDDTDGHIDTLVRIAPNNTLLYIGCDDEADEQYDDLKKMEEQLNTFRTLEGEPYRLVKLPSPRAIFDEDGERLPATYANFLIINGAVLVPTYNQPDLDAEAMSLIGEVFPDREIVGIDCRSVIKQHGSLHCCTMQYPKL